MVNITAKTNNGIHSSSMPFQCILVMIKMKSIASIIDDAPAKCKEKIALPNRDP